MQMGLDFDMYVINFYGPKIDSNASGPNMNVKWTVMHMGLELMQVNWTNWIEMYWIEGA